MTMPTKWPRCWKRVPAYLMRAVAREAHAYGNGETTQIVQAPSGWAGHELAAEINYAVNRVGHTMRSRAHAGASMLYGLAAMGDFVGTIACRIRGCLLPAWPSFDGVCFHHGMFPEGSEKR